MIRKMYKPEQIIGMLREAEIRLSQGQTVDEICRDFGISEQSYNRWRRESTIADAVSTAAEKLARPIG